MPIAFLRRHAPYGSDQVPDEAGQSRPLGRMARQPGWPAGLPVALLIAALGRPRPVSCAVASAWTAGSKSSAATCMPPAAAFQQRHRLSLELGRELPSRRRHQITFLALKERTRGVHETGGRSPDPGPGQLAHTLKLGGAARGLVAAGPLQSANGRDCTGLSFPSRAGTVGSPARHVPV